MLQISVILFREMLEITLIVGLLMAATQGVINRNIYISIGIVIGAISSAIIAASINNLSNFADGSGQDLLNISVLSISVIMIGFTVVWMKKHVSSLNNEIKKTSIAIKSGDLPSFTITTIIAMAVMREGAEIILLCYGLKVTINHNLSSLITGGLIGSLLGILVGGLIYFGLINFCRKYIFLVTNWLLIFLAASTASQIPNFLASAGYLTKYTDPLWNSASLISERSLIGNVLHMLFGYSEQPSLMQIIFYLGTFGIISSYFISSSSRQDKIYKDN
jgi:high-affinity iron transporter